LRTPIRKKGKKKKRSRVAKSSSKAKKKNLLKITRKKNLRRELPADAGRKKKELPSFHSDSFHEKERSQKGRSQEGGKLLARASSKGKRKKNGEGMADR